MKALSIQQPWAYCITHGTKRVENRTWYARHRGWLLLHAGKRYQTGMETLIHADSPEVDVAGMLTAPRGALVGFCRVVECIGPGDDSRVHPTQRIWSDPAQFKLVIDHVHVFDSPIACGGARRLFDVPARIRDGQLYLRTRDIAGGETYDQAFTLIPSRPSSFRRTAA